MTPTVCPCGIVRERCTYHEDWSPRIPATVVLSVTPLDMPDAGQWWRCVVYPEWDAPKQGIRVVPGPSAAITPGTHGAYLEFADENYCIWFDPSTGKLDSPGAWERWKDATTKF